MSKYYHPQTLEHINTNNPAPWMREASTEAPEYDSKTQGCFYKNGAWIVEDVDAGVAEKEQRIAKIDEELAKLDLASIRAIRAISAGSETNADKARLQVIEADIQALRKERTELAGAS